MSALVYPALRVHKQRNCCSCVGNTGLHSYEHRGEMLSSTSLTICVQRYQATRQLKQTSFPEKVYSIIRQLGPATAYAPPPSNAIHGIVYTAEMHKLHHYILPGRAMHNAYTHTHTTQRRAGRERGEQANILQSKKAGTRTLHQHAQRRRSSELDNLASQGHSIIGNLDVAFSAHQRRACASRWLRRIS